MTARAPDVPQNRRMQIVRTADRPDLEAKTDTAFRERWPEFVLHDDVVPTYLPRVKEYFADFSVLLVVDDDTVAAGGWGVPFAWDQTVADLPDGYDGALRRSVTDHEAGRPASTLSFMAVAVAGGYDKRGLAGRVLEALISRADHHGVDHVVAPLRPTLKHRYPLQPMAEYATWTRPDGLSVDPWIRTHQRMGATILGTAPRSMTVSGTVAEWESWTGMAFPASGAYVVPDGLNLLTVDRQGDRAVYVEENLWVRHR